MRMRRSIRWGRVFLVSVLGFGLVSCRRNSEAERQGILPVTRPHGDLIDASAPSPDAGGGALTRRKHPKPPSVQRRMVLAELVLLSQSNFDNTTMPSGTLGTAADLAKTNLPSITRLAAPDLLIAGYRNIAFSVLSGFDYELKDITNAISGPSEATALATGQIPASVRDLNGAKVIIEGFLLPVTMNNGLAIEFLLMRNQSMCCYGVPPKINEWITVQASGKGVKPVMDQPIAVAGVLHVGPILENGSLAGIYRLDAEKISAPF